MTVQLASFFQKACLSKPLGVNDSDASSIGFGGPHQFSKDDIGRSSITEHRGWMQADILVGAKQPVQACRERHTTFQLLSCLVAGPQAEAMAFGALLSAAM